MMAFETARRTYAGIEAAKSSELKDALVRYAVSYARMRTDWSLATRNEREEMDQRRKAMHNAFIDACNILSRRMAKEGEDISWRELLGQDRRTVGDFACHLHCIVGLAAR